MRNFKLVLLASILVIGQMVQADEGMWLPSLLSKVNVDQMYQMGAKLSADEIYNINSSSLKDAIIAIGYGSCTGEMVSAEGLFFTNHHCAYSDIQKHSTEEQNILRDGFWAMNKDEELPNTGKSVSFLIRVEDVTQQVLANVNPGMVDDERNDEINKVSNQLIDQAIKDTHYNARVRSIFRENQYLLFVYETFTDVRLVGVPPHFIGKFGGDTDNWMWPRHTGDFTLYRIYTAPDGKPADYSADNVPLKPRHFLPISLKGYEKGDFAMVMGYPGTTTRYLTANGVEDTMEKTNAVRINVRKAKLDIINEYMATSEKATIQYANKKQGSSNYYKYSIGQNKGIENLDVVAKKRAIENEFSTWVNQDDARTAKYGNALSLINEAYANNNDDKALEYINEAFLRGPEIFTYANSFNLLHGHLSSQSGKEVIAEDVENLKSKMAGFFKDYDSNTDQQIVAALTQIYADHVVPEYHPLFIQNIKTKFKGDYSKWAESVFRKSMMNNEQKVSRFLEQPKLSVLEKDPAFLASKEIYALRTKVDNDNKTDKTNLSVGYRLLMEGLMEMDADKNYYPDANGTMRLTYGTVGDYIPRDGVHYSYYTTLKGYIEKEIPGDSEFDVWPRLKELYHENNFGDYADTDGTLHTCFTTNNDITGGNSGSPVINANGELIGIAFDGNWEAMSGDIAFEPELQKCINVDIRFVIWVIDQFAGASHLVDEMILVK